MYIKIAILKTYNPNICIIYSQRWMSRNLLWREIISGYSKYEMQFFYVK